MYSWQALSPRHESAAKLTLEWLNRIKCLVVEVLLSQLISDMFNRVQLLGIWQQTEQMRIRWHLECIAASPPALSNTMMMRRVASRDLIQENRHAARTHMWQDQ